MTPHPVLLPGKAHGWRSLVGCSPRGREELDKTEWLHFHFSLSCIGEGNDNPLQCSWLENPRDGGAWWAAVYGVAQSWTRLKQRSSSSSLCRKVKPKFRIFIDSFENKLLAFPAWKGSSIGNMVPIYELISSRNGAKMRVECWSLVLAIWTFDIGFRLSSRSKCCWAHTLPQPQSSGPLYSCAHCSSTGVASERDWPISLVKSFLILASSVGDVLLWALA